MQALGKYLAVPAEPKQRAQSDAREVKAMFERFRARQQESGDGVQ